MLQNCNLSGHQEWQWNSLSVNLPFLSKLPRTPNRVFSVNRIPNVSRGGAHTMAKREESWRLLDFDTPDPKMNLAVSEAIFRCKRAGLSPNTLYLWRTAKPVILFYSVSQTSNFCSN